MLTPLHSARDTPLSLVPKCRIEVQPPSPEIVCSTTHRLARVGWERTDRPRSCICFELLGEGIGPNALCIFTLRSGEKRRNRPDLAVRLGFAKRGNPPH